MLYAQWVQKVLEAASGCENKRTRLVGVPSAALREPLDIGDTDIDAIEDAVYDLEVLGLARRRSNSFFNLTPLGRQAAAQSIEDLYGNTIREICGSLIDDQRSFVQVLMRLSEMDQTHFARLRFVNVVEVFERIGVESTHEDEETFLLPLVERNCIEYQEFKSDRDARPLLTGVMCVRP